MDDFIAFLSDRSLWSLLAIAFAVDIVLTVAVLRFIRSALYGPFDPLRVQLILYTCPAMTGYALSPVANGAWTTSYFIIVAFIAVWFLVIRMAGRARTVSMNDGMRPDFQTVLLWIAGAVIVLNVIVNMIIPGTIPLFTEEGLNSRFESGQNSRFLTWLNFGTVTIPGLIFAVTEHPAVRRRATVALGLQLIAGFLFASKGAILSIIFVLLFALFVAHQRGERHRVRSLSKALKLILVPVLGLIPIYFSFIGFASDSSAIFSLGLRLFAGFDQLIPAAQLGLVGGPNGVFDFGATLVEYQAMPVFKAILGNDYHYANVGQFVIEAATGILIEGGFTFPNSNLILETTFTSGPFLGFILYALELAAFYSIRRFLISSTLTAARLPWFAATVMAPCGLFLSGQEWVVSLLMMIFVVSIAGALTALWRLAFVARPKAKPAVVILAGAP